MKRVFSFQRLVTGFFCLGLLAAAVYFYLRPPGDDVPRAPTMTVQAPVIPGPQAKAESSTDEEEPDEDAPPARASQYSPAARSFAPFLAFVDQPPRPARPSPAPKEAAPKKPSMAESIAYVQRRVESSERQIEAIKRDLATPFGEYHQADISFKTLNDLMAERRKALDKAKAENRAEEAAHLQAKVKELEPEWRQARDRFNLAIEERQLMQGKLQALQTQLTNDKQILDRIRGITQPAPTTEAKATPPTTAPATPPENKATASAPTKAEEKPPLGSPLGPVQAAMSTSAAAELPAANRPHPRIVKARDELKAKEEAAKQAQGKVERIAKTLDNLKQGIDLDVKLLDNARKKAAQAQKAQTRLQKDLEAKQAAGADQAMLDAITAAITAAQQRQQEAQADAEASQGRLDDLQAEFKRVATIQERLIAESEQAQRDATAAKDALLSLESPWSVLNVQMWLEQHGAKLLAILTGMFTMRWIVRFFSRRVVRLVARTTTRGGTAQHESRTDTLVSVLNNATNIVIFGGGLLMLLDAAGIPIVPLMGGAAVVGLAVAFGAQNLMKDYLSGFMVLIEDQYGINDVIQVGAVVGKVEAITLRMTTIRDGNGVVHFIPHGTIATVSNLTHGWSKAAFEIGVSYKEDVDAVMALLLDLAQDLRRDTAWSSLILDDAEMQGVDRFEDSSVVIKFNMKTQPLEQWKVQRELLRRIKKAFDERGIEIPYPHRTVYHRYEGPVPAQAPGDASRAAA